MHLFSKNYLNRKILKQINKKYYLINSLKDPIINSKIKQEKVNLIVSAGFPYIFGEKFFLRKKN